MRILPTAFTLALTLLFSACGGNKHEAAAEESIKLMEQIGTTLESVKDEASAKTAATKLEPTMTRMTALKKEMEALGKPADDADGAMQAKYEARMQAAMTKMMTQMGRVMGEPKWSAILQPVMEKMGG
jgi:hypothetical protein